MNLRQLNQKIDGLAKRNAKFRQDVQVILCSCAQFAFGADQNVEPFTRLVTKMEGLDATALIKWVETHTPSRWKKDEAKFVFNHSFKGEYDAIALLSQPWWVYAKKAKEVSSTLDMYDALNDFIKRMEREAKTKTVTHAEILTDLKAISGRLAQAQIETEAQ